MIQSGRWWRPSVVGASAESAQAHAAVHREDREAAAGKASVGTAGDDVAGDQRRGRRRGRMAAADENPSLVRE